jgi:hypothetical protein
MRPIEPPAHVTALDIEPLPRRTLLGFALGVAAIAFLATLVRSDDPDMFHHLALGRQIVRSGLPALEPFVYPMRGELTGPPSYWLGSVAIYASQALLGDVGVSLLPAAIGALLALVWLADARPRLGRHTAISVAAALLPIALALETFRYRAVARTEIFSAALLAVTMLAIRRFEEGRPRALLAFPLLAVPWVNLHPGMTVAFAVLGIHLASEAAAFLVRRWRDRPVPSAPTARSLATLAAVIALGLAATTLNPAPGNPAVEAFRFVTTALRAGGAAPGAGGAGGAVLRNVQELRGGGMALFGTPAGVLILVSALGFALRWRSVRLREVVTVATFAALPFVAVRFALFFAVVAAPIAARNLGEAASALPRHAGGIPARATAAVALAVAAIASIPLGALAPHIRFGAGTARGIFPVRGADYLESLKFGGKLFNSFHFGGYLEWREIGPPFQDGRGVVRPEDAAAAMAGPTMWPLFVPLDARYRFDALLMAYPGGDPASGASLGMFEPDRSTWALVAFDDAGLVYLRRDGAYAEAARRDEFRVAAPTYPMLQLPPRDLPGELADYRRAVREAPDCFRCRYFLGELALAAGAPDEARIAVTPVVARAFGRERAVLESVVARAGEALRAQPTAYPPVPR